MLHYNRVTLIVVFDHTVSVSIMSCTHMQSNLTSFPIHQGKLTQCKTKPYNSMIQALYKSQEAAMTKLKILDLIKVLCCLFNVHNFPVLHLNVSFIILKQFKDGMTFDYTIENNK